MKYKLVSYIILLLLLAEMGLRIYPGLGYPLLFEHHPSYDYQLKANQKTTRLFKTLKTNSLGLRSEEPQANKKRVLKIGDSVINGGERLGNDELSTTLLGSKLGDAYEVQNLSCGSWGPENQLKFLEAHPELRADAYLLYLSSHDLFDTIGRFSPVGISLDHPKYNPPFALWELFESFVFKKLWFPEEAVAIREDKQGKHALEALFSFLKSQQKPVTVFLHPTVAEIQNGKWDWKAKQMMNVLDSFQLNTVSNLEHMDSTMYRDDIHLNEKGHKFLAVQAYQLLLARGWIEE